MKKPLIPFIVGLILLSFACGLFAPLSTPDASPSVVPSLEVATVIQETIPAPTFTPIPTFTSVPPTQSVPPPAASSPEPDYIMTEERLINGYAIRVWRKPASEIGFEDILLIQSGGQPTIRVDMFSALNDLTGTDVNGDGYPDVVVETFSGGAHCCFGTQVYSLRPTPALILEKPESNAGGQFQDLNGDDVLEFITYDDSFAYQYCPYAAGVVVKAILAYDAARDQYIPASPRFPDQYAEEITRNTSRAASPPGEFGEWDGSNICAVLPLALDYLYLGQPETAWTEFYSRYSGADVDSKWNEILQVVRGSPLYTP